MNYQKFTCTFYIQNTFTYVLYVNIDFQEKKKIKTQDVSRR